MYTNTEAIKLAGHVSLDERRGNPIDLLVGRQFVQAPEDL
jgi:hypothetical protein